MTCVSSILWQYISPSNDGWFIANPGHTKHYLDIPSISLLHELMVFRSRVNRVPRNKEVVGMVESKIWDERWKPTRICMVYHLDFPAVCGNSEIIWCIWGMIFIGCSGSSSGEHARNVLRCVLINMENDSALRNGLLQISCIKGYIRFW